jgi:hypothetical protein
MKKLFAALALCLAAIPVAALAASAPTPKPCSSAENRQFDFWVGDWRVTDPQGKFAGTNDVTVEYGGCVVQEHWRGAGGDVGSSFNSYRPSTKMWHQTWVDNQGQVILLDGTYANGVMNLRGPFTTRKGGAAINRIRWTRIDGDHVRQLWDYSLDGGKSWKVAFDGLYARVK